jgi:hypothetical protein
VERWDGQIKRYTVSSSGTAHSYLFGAISHVIEELKGQMTDNCLGLILNQDVHDTTLYLASEAVLLEADIRTVLVRARRAVTDVLPVSTNPVFPPQ